MTPTSFTTRQLKWPNQGTHLGVSITQARSLNSPVPLAVAISNGLVFLLDSDLNPLVGPDYRDAVIQPFGDLTAAQAKGMLWKLRIHLSPSGKHLLSTLNLYSAEDKHRLGYQAAIRSGMSLASLYSFRSSDNFAEDVSFAGMRASDALLHAIESGSAPEVRSVDSGAWHPDNDLLVFAGNDGLWTWEQDREPVRIDPRKKECISRIRVGKDFLVLSQLLPDATSDRGPLSLHGLTLDGRHLGTLEPVEGDISVEPKTPVAHIYGDFDGWCYRRFDFQTQALSSKSAAPGQQGEWPMAFDAEGYQVRFRDRNKYQVLDPFGAIAAEVNHNTVFEQLALWGDDQTLIGFNSSTPGEIHVASWRSETGPVKREGAYVICSPSLNGLAVLLERMPNDIHGASPERVLVAEGQVIERASATMSLAGLFRGPGSKQSPQVNSGALDLSSIIRRYKPDEALPAGEQKALGALGLRLPKTGRQVCVWGSGAAVEEGRDLRILSAGRSALIPDSRFSFAAPDRDQGRVAITRGPNVEVWQFDGPVGATLLWSSPFQNPTKIEETFLCAAWHPSGQFIACSSIEKDCVWNAVGAGEPLATHSGFERKQTWLEGFAQCSWSPDGHWLAVTRLGELLLYSFAVERLIVETHKRSESNPIAAHCWSRDSKHLFLVGSHLDASGMLPIVAFDTGRSPKGV